MKINMNDERLSIGDYVTFLTDRRSSILQVTGIDGGGVFASSDELNKLNSYYHYVHISPIPITPEILERLGFEEESDGCFCLYISEHSNDDFFKFEFHRETNVLELESAFTAHVEHVNYVHHLQTLVYVLTGEKLTLGGEV